MQIVQLDGKTYKVSPGGRVWASYETSAQPGRTLWRRMEKDSVRSKRARQAAGLEPIAPPLPKRGQEHLYVRLYTDFRRG